MLAEHINKIPEPVIWLDCGADIGILTALVAAQCTGIKEVIALEPNAAAFRYLKRNLELLPVPGRAICAAAADFRGQGTLAYSPHDSSDHSRFLAASPGGELDVLRIDDLAIDPGQPVALKVDVEGGELAVLQGAERTLADATDWIVTIEAHRDVFHRTRIDPLECVRFLEQLGHAEIRVSERPEMKLNLDQPFFQQTDDRILNLMCIHRA
jgi:FkbM family methyltransferase